MIRITACLFCAAAALAAQPAATPRFEVASIKPTPADQYNGSSGITTGHGRIKAERVTLKRCILGAYGIGPNQIAGGPPWLDTDRFEIDAKADRPIDDDGALMVMLQTLLADRFKLAYHHETKTVEALALEVGRNGPKLEKAPDAESTTNSRRGSIDARATTMDHFAWVLSRDLNLPVVDRTGLEGAFNLKLTWSPESDRPLKPGETPPADAGPSLFTAIQEQLGLRLQARKMPIDILVIDHSERPSEN